MKLPFIKESKLPRIAKPMDEKLYGGSADEHLEDHCLSELMDAYSAKDPSLFRQALEALVLNLFESEESHDAP